MISLSHAVSSSTPSISIVDVPAPTTCAPIRSRNAARSVTSGSRAAFSITVPPLARTAADIRFSVAPTLGNSRTCRAPARRWACACTKPCSTSTRAPIASSPRRCMSTLRLPMRSPPGSATRASPHRAMSGPRTLNDARISETSSYGASGRSSAPASIRTSAPGNSSTCGTYGAQQVGHHLEVADDGHVVERGHAGREQCGGHLLGAGVLRRARDRDLAVERPARVDAERRHEPSYFGVRCSMNAVIASRMSFERNAIACASASTTKPSRTGRWVDAATARLAPCTASGG